MKLVRINGELSVLGNNAATKLLLTNEKRREGTMLWRELFNGKQEIKPRETLAQKIAEACDSVEGIKKLGDNGKFKYQRMADLALGIRHALFSRHIVIIPTDAESHQSSFETNDGGTMFEVKAKISYTLTDGVESIYGMGYGVGRDREDKALYKAMTGSLKYFLRTVGLIADLEDDPESGESELEEVRPDLAKKIDEQSQPSELNYEVVSKIEVRAFNSACKKHGRNLSQRRGWLLTKGAARIEELPKAQFREALAWAMNEMPLAEQVQASVQLIRQEKAQQAIVDALDAPTEHLADAI